MASYIYVIGSNPEGPVKIGFSKQPAVRLKQLQTGHADALRLFHTEAIDEDRVLIMEQIIPRENRVHKKKGEWFSLTVENAIFEVQHAVMRFEQEADWRTHR